MELESWWKSWKQAIAENKVELLVAISLLIIAEILNYLAGNYVDKVGSAAVQDLVLDNLPSVNLNFIFIYFIIAVVIVFFIYALVFQAKRLPEIMGTVSLFIVLRALFISLTHLKIPEGAILSSYPWFLNTYGFSNDLFFSGHTGFPFLGFLMFKNKCIKYFMLLASIVMATTALLMHQHYSIDVAAAYFITYGVYKIGRALFKSS